MGQKDINARTVLADFVKAHGSQRKAATALNVSNTTIGAMLRGELKISEKVARGLGLRLVTRAERMA